MSNRNSSSSEGECDERSPKTIDRKTPLKIPQIHQYGLKSCWEREKWGRRNFEMCEARRMRAGDNMANITPKAAISCCHKEINSVLVSVFTLRFVDTLERLLEERNSLLRGGGWESLRVMSSDLCYVGVDRFRSFRSLNIANIIFDVLLSWFSWVFEEMDFYLTI